MLRVFSWVPVFTAVVCGVVVLLLSLFTRSRGPEVSRLSDDTLLTQSGQTAGFCDQNCHRHIIAPGRRGVSNHPLLESKCCWSVQRRLPTCHRQHAEPEVPVGPDLSDGSMSAAVSGWDTISLVFLYLAENS